MPDTISLIANALPEEAGHRQNRLDTLLSESDQLDAWIQLASSPELRRLLEGRRAALALDALALLVEWRRMGGVWDASSPAAPDRREALDVRPDLRSDLRAPRQERRDVREDRTDERHSPRIDARIDARIDTRIDARIDARPDPRHDTRPDPRPDARPDARPDHTDTEEEPLRADPRAWREPLADWRPELLSLLAACALSHDDEAELERIYQGIRNSDRWRGLPKDIQRNLVGLLASRLRRLQDERDFSSPRIEESFSRLSAYSKREQPGYVIGLSRHHHPLRDSWGEDADAYWERLNAWLPAPPQPPPINENLIKAITSGAAELTPGLPAELQEAVSATLRRHVRGALEAGVPASHPQLLAACAPIVHLLEGADFLLLRRALREDRVYNMPEAQERAADPASLLPADWRWWSRTRNRHALIVGGTFTEDDLTRLKEAFHFTELEWDPVQNHRTDLLGVRDRITYGRIDIVILLSTHIGHEADEIILPACRSRGADWVLAEKGTSVLRLRRAMEHFLDPAPPEDAR